MLQKDQTKRWDIEKIKDFLIDLGDLKILRKLNEDEIDSLVKNYIKSNSVGELKFIPLNVNEILTGKAPVRHKKETT